jgi:hypothetical protein
MLRNYYINKEFIVSATARKFYRFSAAISLSMFVIIFVCALPGGAPGILRPFLRQLLFIGAFGTATTLVAMEYFLFAFDRSPLFKKVCWFLLVALVPLPCVAVYCFRTYSRSVSANEAGTVTEELSNT